MPSFTTTPEVPEDAAALDMSASGVDLEDREFWVWTTGMTVYGAHVMLGVTREGLTMTCRVAELQKPWHEPRYDRDQKDYLYRLRVLNSPDRMGAASSYAYGMAVQTAARMLGVLNAPLIAQTADYTTKRAEYEAEEQRRAAQWEAERAERRAAAERERLAHMEAARARYRSENAKAKELYEHTRWLLEHQFRLTRDGKKSTVFGTIKRVGEPRLLEVNQADRWGSRNYEGPRMMDYTAVSMGTVSERGKHMTIRLAEITTLDVKYDGERRFSPVYPTSEEAT